MTGRLPAFAYAGSPCIADVREFLDTWGGQLAASVLPGIILITPLLFGPRELVLMGPTVVTVTFMALVFTVALPLHAFRQFQALRDGEPSEPAGHVDDELPWSVAGVEGWTAGGPALRQRPKSHRVAALETALLDHAGLASPASERSAPTGPCAGPGLRTAFMPRSARIALEQAFADLDLFPGASIEEVRRSYRRHMRVFHPDQHRSDRRTHQLAEALARELTAAYSTIAATLRLR